MLRARASALPGPTPLGNDVIAWVVRNRQPLLLMNVEQAQQIGFDEHGLTPFEVRSAQSGLRLHDSRVPQSLLVVPIISGDVVLGVIDIQSYETRAFDDQDLRFVITVANQAAAAISNISLFIERGRRLEELAIFNEVGRALSSTVSFEELPGLLYRQTSRLLDTTNFYIAVLDEDRDELTFPVFYEEGVLRDVPSVPESSPSQAGRPNSLRPMFGIRNWPLVVRLTRHVMQRGEPLLISERELNEDGWLVELPRDVRPQQQDMPYHWLGVPMIVTDKVIGVIAVRDYERRYSYTQDELRILSTISSSAAISLENARLFEQISRLAADLEIRVAERTRELATANMQLLEEKERLETVHAITLELTASLDLDEIIGRALEMASTNLNVSRGSIMMRDTQTGALFCRALLQDQGLVTSVSIPITFQGGDSLAQWVVYNREPVRIADVRGDERWVHEEGRADEARSVIAVPLMTNDATLGVLMLTSDKLNYFAESQLRLLETIANEIAIAINNAQLYSYITEMASRLADLLDQQREETSKSRAIFQSMTEGVVVLDQHERVAVFNAAAEHTLGIPARYVLDQPMTTIATHGATKFKQQRAETIYQELHDGLKLAKERESIYRTSFELEDPQQIISVSLTSVRGLDGQIYGDVAVLRDITPEIEADRAKRRFISQVSHELRTPLTSISGYIDLLRLGAGGPLNQEQHELINVVRTNIKRLRGLVDDILEISRFESGKTVIDLVIKPIDIGVIINDVVRSLRIEGEKKNMQVTVNVQENLPFVQADEKRITQIIFNLFSNAIKYTYEGGRVTVRAFLNQANLLQFEVEDNGVGMSAADQEKLFRPFSRALNPLSEQAGGTGLGLMITKSLIELHGGEIWVESEPGKGSIFRFVLPLEQPESEKPTDATEGETGE
ncbi:MAG: GAF domain-containing protein [Chloroflexaceae bacterium]|nr:GAF domain-containing protein [Chloroflexaceae bacterium]